MFPESIIAATRQHFADNKTACIADVLNGTLKPNDPQECIAVWERERAACLAGAYDHTFTFRQYAHYLQTGECVGLLGNGSR